MSSASARIVAHEPRHRADQKCPRCGQRAAVPDNHPSSCDSCGAGLIVDGGRVFDVAAYPRRIDSADVRALISADLRQHHASAEFRLVDVHPISLPYWLASNGTLHAAFTSPLDAIQKLAAPAGVAPPARIERLPHVPAAGVEGNVARLVILPGFDVFYEASGRSFHAIVDAHQGRVHADLHPHPRPLRLPPLMAVVLAADVVVFALAAWSAPDNVWRSIVVSALVYPIYTWNRAAMARAYRED